MRSPRLRQALLCSLVRTRVVGSVTKDQVTLMMFKVMMSDAEVSRKNMPPENDMAKMVALLRSIQIVVDVGDVL